MTQKSDAIENIDIFDYLKGYMAKTLYTKSKTTNQKKIFANICKIKNLVSLIYKELLKIDKKETKILQKDLQKSLEKIE